MNLFLLQSLDQLQVWQVKKEAYRCHLTSLFPSIIFLIKHLFNYLYIINHPSNHYHSNQCNTTYHKILSNSPLTKIHNIKITIQSKICNKISQNQKNQKINLNCCILGRKEPFLKRSKNKRRERRKRKRKKEGNRHLLFLT